jgi:hypothetical protein
MKESCAGGDVEEAEILHTEAVFIGRRLVLVGVLKELVPDGKGILLLLPPLFLAQIRDRSIEPERLVDRCVVGRPEAESQVMRPLEVWLTKGVRPRWAMPANKP